MKALLIIIAGCTLSAAWTASGAATDAYVEEKAAGPMGTEGYMSLEHTEIEATDSKVKDASEAEETNLPESDEFNDEASLQSGAYSGAPFPPDVPNLRNRWRRVGYLDMSDPTQQCPASLRKFSSPRASCGKRSDGEGCDSVRIRTHGWRYRRVCGRFRGYQIGSPDAFSVCCGSRKNTIEDAYVDGISITHGVPGNRQHIFTYAAGLVSSPSGNVQCSCPCAGGKAPPSFVGTDYYCESGVRGSRWSWATFYYSDILWDGQQCDGSERGCCLQPNLPWFCKTFPTHISGDIEVRLCMDQHLRDEDLALEFFELYIK